MTRPLPITGIGRLAPEDSQINFTKKFPASLEEGKQLERAKRTTGTLSGPAQVKLSNFIDGRGLYQAVQKDGWLILLELDVNQTILLGLYGSLVDKAQR